MISKIYRIKQEKLELWQNWCSDLNTKFRDAAINTLIEEGVEFELFVNFQIEDKWYAVGVSVLENQVLKPSNPAIEINRKHKEIKIDCLEYIGDGTEGYFLKQ